MFGGSRLRALFAVLAAATASLALAGTAGASSGDGGGGGVVIEAQDACDPATFVDPATGESLCSRTDGNSGRRVTFERLFGRLMDKGAHNAWRFSPDNVTVKADEPVTVRMGRGGEFHTFTKVAAFGPGCVGVLNDVIFGPNAPMPAACGDIVLAPDGTPAPRPFVEDGVLPMGATLPAGKLTPGVNMFQCMIHPWMHATVTVE